MAKLVSQTESPASARCIARRRSPGMTKRVSQNRGPGVSRLVTSDDRGSVLRFPLPQFENIPRSQTGEGQPPLIER